MFHSVRNRSFALVLIALCCFVAISTTAHGQNQDAVTELARQKFIEGVQSYDSGKYAEARASFLQAYALKRHPVVLLNLGQSELKAGFPVAAGNHLQQFLREYKEATPDQKATARAGIEEAKKRCGVAILIVDTDGAVISIDGQALGRSPLLDPIFVKAGRHQAAANNGTRTVSVQFNARRGTTTPVTLSFNMPVAPPTPVRPAQPAAPAPTMPQAPPPVMPMQPQPPMGPMAQPPGMMRPVPPARPGREDPIDWFTRKPIAWATVGVTGLGVLGTIGFGIAAADANAAADDVQTQIVNEVAAQNNLPPEYINNGQATPCGTRDGSFPAHPYYAQACQQLTENLDSYDTDMALMGVSIGLAVVGAGATVAYYFIDTDSSSVTGKAKPKQGPSIIGIAPVVTEQHKGVGLVGTF